MAIIVINVELIFVTIVTIVYSYLSHQRRLIQCHIIRKVATTYYLSKVTMPSDFCSILLSEVNCTIHT